MIHDTIDGGDVKKYFRKYKNENMKFVDKIQVSELFFFHEVFSKLSFQTKAICKNRDTYESEAFVWFNS